MDVSVATRACQGNGHDHRFKSSTERQVISEWCPKPLYILYWSWTVVHDARDVQPMTVAVAVDAYVSGHARIAQESRREVLSLARLRIRYQISSHRRRSVAPACSAGNSTDDHDTSCAAAIASTAAMSTDYGNFHNFCRDSGSGHATLPVCNLFDEALARGGNGYGGCELIGISLSGGRQLANLGSMLVDFFAILTTLYLLWRSERKKAAVGRREMQFFLIGFIIIEICEIFTIGGFPLNGIVRRAFSAAHIAAIVTTLWILMMNGAVGYQLLDDGTFLSIGLIFGSAAALFIGTGYIALDTGFSWTGFWTSTLQDPNRNYALYTLYQLVPLVFLVVYFLLETVLVLRVLGEVRPMCKSSDQCLAIYHLTLLQSTSSLLRSSLPLARSSNMSSAYTSAMAAMAQSMAASSSPCLLGPL
nr:chitin synthase export chaperone [Quercus suber]